MATTTISSISDMPRMRFATSALVGILFAPYGLDAAVGCEAEGENLGARHDHDRFSSQRRGAAVGARLRRGKQEGHSRCDTSLRPRGVSVGDRQIVLIVQIINRAAVEDADRADAGVSRSRR